MKLNTNSNAYIILYSAILVVIVAFLLAFVYQALKPMQDANVALDVKKQILYSSIFATSTVQRLRPSTKRW